MVFARAQEPRTVSIVTVLVRFVGYAERMFEEPLPILLTIRSWWQRVQIVSSLTKLVQLPVWAVLVAVLGGLGGVGACAVGLLQVASTGVHAQQIPTVAHSAETEIASPDADLAVRPSPSEQRVVVEVSGAVAKPGVYTLDSDARLVDALTAAQGATTDADQYYMSRALNQSARLTDGQKIFIPTPDDQSIELACADILGRTDQSTLADDSSGGGDEALVSINEASQSELEALPGIGSKRASDIIAGRPYAAAEQLLTTGVVTEKIFEAIENLITL